MLAATLASIALLPGLLTPTVADVKSSSDLPILAPSTLLIKEKQVKLYAHGTSDPSQYTFFLSTQKDCTANVCSVAYISGRKGMQLYGAKRVALAKGRKGRYSPLSCGASCSPPSITWKEDDVLYEIQTSATRAQLVKMANSAIKTGPR